MKTMKIEVELSEYRTCLIRGRKALFHKWDVKEDIFFKFNNIISEKNMLEIQKHIKSNRIIPQYSDSVKVSNTYALVEFEDGTVKYVNPEDIVFLDSDNKFNERYL